MNLLTAMPTTGSSDSPGITDEIASLIATLRATEGRLDEITAGEIDSVFDAEGNTLLLRHAQNGMRHRAAARHAATLDALPLHICLINSRGEISSVNAPWQSLADANSVQCRGLGVGTNYLDVCDRADGDEREFARQAANGIRAVLSGDAENFSLEYPCHSPGQQRWFLMRASPVASAESIGAVVMHLDISSRRLAELDQQESETRFRQLAESVEEVFFLLNADRSRVLYVSPAYGKTWGRSQESAYQDPASWIAAIHDDDRAEFIEGNDANPGDPSDAEFRLVRPDGSIRWIHARRYPVLGADGTLIRIAAVATDITDTKLAIDSLADSQQRLALATGSAGIGIWDLDLVTNKLYWDAKMYALYGTTEREFSGAYSAWQEGLHPEDLARAEAEFAEAVAGGKGFHTQFRVVWPGGEVRFIEAHAQVRPGADGKPARIVGVNFDITERKRSELSIKNLNRVYAVLSGINGLIVRVRDRAELFNRACEIAVEHGGFRMAMIGMLKPGALALDVVASAGKDPPFVAKIERLLACNASDPNTMAAWVIRERTVAVANDSQNDPRVLLGEEYKKAGVRSLAVFPLLVAGASVGVLALYSNELNFFHETELKLLRELADDISFAVDYIDKSHRLDYLAFYDVLTGLPNSTLFKDRLDKFVHAAKQDQANVSVVVLDLERFTQVNDSLGRGAGDELLRAVATRLGQFLVEPYALARIGADTFAVAAPYAADAEPTALWDCVLKALSTSFYVADRKLNVSAQAGISLYPVDGATGDELFTNAESALKLAKTSGARFTYFSKAVNSRMEERFELAHQLRDALAERQFVLHYQPRVDMISGEAVGAEALLRWAHPVRGLMAPTEFITLAEETGLIIPIGAFVLDSVCAQQAAWIAEGLGAVPVAVNLSSVQFEKGDLVELVEAALARHRLPARMLELELTESAVMNNPVAAAATLKALRRLGVGLALDDFGTGYSSLAHLKGFPFNMIKIDRSFIDGITKNVEDAAIAKAIIAMAHGLQLRVVAEGVETQGQFNFLRNLACNEMQGHLYSTAVSAACFREQLSSRRRMVLAPDAGPDQRTLLMVDDDPGILASLTRMLRRDGYRILHANGGEQGLEMLALHDIQVIISDQRMPGMSGTEFLSKVSQLHPDTVRIILSGFTDLKVVTEAVNRGSVFKFLTKPWDDEQLREQVRDAFRRHRSDADALT